MLIIFLVLKPDSLPETSGVCYVWAKYKHRDQRLSSMQSLSQFMFKLEVER